MNERIEKLSQLAWTKTSKAVPFYDSTGNISRDFNLKYQQEFAELIVKECADIADLNNCGSNDEWDKCARAISRDIKLTFGVEE